MRILHTSDLHLNCLRARFSQYLERARKALWSILAVAVDQGVEHIIVAGDVFEQPNLTIAERQLLSDWLAAVADEDIALIAISGNHDKRSTAIGDTCLSYLSPLNPSGHLIVDGDPSIDTIRGVTFITIPYQGWTNQEFYLIVTALVEQALVQAGGTPIVAIGHEAVAGCRNDSGIEVGTSVSQIVIPEDLPVNYWALGDMHICQDIAGHVCYSGAPFQTRFGEVLPKGVVVVDLLEGTREFIALTEPEELVQLSKVQESWPPFCKFAPSEPYLGYIPAEVDYQAPVRAVITDEDLQPELTAQRPVDVLERLPNYLADRNPDWDEDLLATTCSLAETMLEKVQLGSRK